MNGKSNNSFTIVVLVCPIFTVLLAFFFWVNVYSCNRFVTLFLVCPIRIVSHCNKILT